MKILAATDFSTRSNRGLRQAGLLAEGCGASLTVVHVVDDDQPEELLEMEQREANRILTEQIRSMPELQSVECTQMVVTGSPFSGIIKASLAATADLIVMGAHRRQLLRNIFVGTTVERVIRNGPVPVLMVNREVQRQYNNVLIPVEPSEPSIQALRFVRTSGWIGHTNATLLYAFYAIGKSKLRATGADTTEYENNLRQSATNELIAFLAANDLGSHKWSMRIEEGAPMDVIAQVVAQMRADLVVVGTHARSGLMKEIIGSVAEAVLSSVKADVLVVPPAGR